MQAQPFFRIGHFFAGGIPFGHNAFLGSNSGILRSEIYVAFYIATKLLTKIQRLPSSLIASTTLERKLMK